MKKQGMIILALSGLALSGCTTSKQVRAMIDENNLRYDATIQQLEIEQQATKDQLNESQVQWVNTVNTLEKMRIDTQTLEKARKSLLAYSRQQVVALEQFIQSFEEIQPQTNNTPQLTTPATDD
jgi:arsenate reductase-like glutaredoxin family protein